jgi:hypothetical protein
MGASKQATRFMCTFSTEYFAWDEPDAVRWSTETDPATGRRRSVTARVGYASAVRTGRLYSPVTV